ncbi:MAG: hypothetical protein WHS86_00345 [Desulfosoma sp.]
MKCPKCGFIGSDHVRACAKCGKDLDAVRAELNLLDFMPAVPAFILEAVLAMSHKAAAASATTTAVVAEAAPSGASLDLLGEIDLRVDLDEKPEEITLELLDEGEEPAEELEPMGGAVSSGLALEVSEGERAESEPPPAEAWPEALDLKIDGDAESVEEPGVFDLSDVEDDPELSESLDEEAMTDEALERLRRELESADGILKEIDGHGAEVGEAQAGPSAVVLEPEVPEGALEIDEDLGVDVRELEAPDEAPGRKEEDEDVFILMEERDGGLAVQEFSLEEPAPEEPAGGEFQDEALVLDLDALTEEDAPKPAEGTAAEKEEPAIDGLVLELEDGFYIEPDDEEDR